MSTDLKKIQKTIEENVLSRINGMQESEGLELPKNYSFTNAIKGAWLYIQSVKDKNDKPALDVCTTTSICNSMFEMVIKGLSVIKKQCYFVVYGTELTCQVSYFGNYTMAKRECNVVDAYGQVVYNGDKPGFKYETDLETGVIKILSHTQDIDNIDMNEIAGAYATVVFSDGRKKVIVMSMKQIKENWLFGKAKGNSPAHKRTPDQMAIRTVINRALKIELNSANDEYLGLEEKNTAENQEERKIETIEIEASNPDVVEEIQEEKQVEEKADKKTKTPPF